MAVNVDIANREELKETPTYKPTAEMRRLVTALVYGLHIFASVDVYEPPAKPEAGEPAKSKQEQKHKPLEVTEDNLGDLPPDVLVTAGYRAGYRDVKVDVAEAKK